MTRRPTIEAALVGSAVGLGVWASRAVLDVADLDGALVRVAMLPALWVLAVAVLAGAAVAAGMVGLAARRGPVLAETVLDVLRPLAAAALLVVPYLPWLPDVLPFSVLLAGPGVWLWWGVLAGHAAAALFLHVRSRRPATPIRPSQAAVADATARRRRWTTAIFLASVVASGTLAAQFARTPLFPGGDEPHYLVIAQSLWRDGDLRIENNHQRRDYDEYFHRDLTPHYLTRGVDREIYSIHPIGMPVLMAPVYALGGYALVVCAFVLLGAAALTMAWRLTWAATGSAAAATFGWAALAGGVPWVFNTFSIYPEIPAATATLAAFTATSGWRAGRAHAPPRHLHVGRFVTAGVALGLLPWFSTKYVVMAAAVGLVVLARLWLPWPRGRDERRAALGRTFAVGVPSACSLVLWFSFFQWIWGTWSPAAPYGSQRETRLEYLPQGGPGLLLDQEYGVLLAAPALLLAIPGVWALWRRKETRRLTLEMLATWAGLLGIVGAFHIWWGGSAIVGRPVVAALPLLILPVAAQWRAAAAASWRRVAQSSLLWLGLGLTILVASAQNGLLLVAGRDGTWQWLEYLAPSSNVWTLLPTFLRQPPGAAALLAAAWLVLLVGGGVGLGRAGHRDASHYGRTARSGLAVCLTAVLVWSGVVAAAFPPSTPPQPVDGRPRVRLLDEFDADRRPIALVYTPFSWIDRDAVPGLFPLQVTRAGAATVDRDTQLFGQRLSLPAGRYGVDLVFPAGAPPVDGAIALQVGRAGPAYQAWEIELTPPGTWGRAFDLPVDAGFVGFKVTPDIAAAAPRLRVTPQRIVPAAQRQDAPGVQSSARYSDVQVFVHGDDAWPEAEGLWVRGRATADLTLRTDTLRPVTLDLRAGATPVEVTVTLGDVSREAALSAGGTTTVTFPAGEGPRRLRVTTSDGFVPAEVEPGSRDRRVLGVWMSVR